MFEFTFSNNRKDSETIRLSKFIDSFVPKVNHELVETRFKNSKAITVRFETEEELENFKNSLAEAIQLTEDGFYAI